MSALRSFRLGAAVAAVLWVVACTDASGPTTPASQGAAPRSNAVTLDQEIGDLITRLFPNGLQTATRARWNNVKRDAAKSPVGAPTKATKAQLRTLIAFMQQQEPRLNDPIGEARQHALMRLSLDMLMYVYQSPETPPPPVVTTSEFGIATVSPAATEPTVVQTPSKQGVVEFPAGSVNEETVVILEENKTPYPENCSGPLDTRRCQYPFFYKAHVFPEEKLNIPAKAAVCHVNTGASREPLRGGEFHDRFRLAHDLPADPANYSPGATQEDGIEILRLVHVEPTLMDCSHEGPYEVAFVRRRPGVLGKLLDRSEWLAQNAVRRATRALSPKRAYAIDQGGGGEISFFSNLGIVDPQSAPDLKPQAFTVQETESFAGETVHITALSTTNIGTGSVGATQTSIRFSADEIVTTEDVELASQATAAIVPNQVIAGAPIAVTIPAGTAEGTYYIGMLSDAGGVAAEEDEANNVITVQLTVRRRPTTTIVQCPPTVVYTGAPQTPCSATVTGAGLSAAVPVTYTNNVNFGTASATAAYAGDVNYLPSTASATFDIVGELLGTSGNDAGGADLVRINPVTGASTPIGPVGPFVMPGIAYDASTGKLFGGRGAGTPWFYVVNPTTGVATLIGDSGLGFAALSALTPRRSDGAILASVNIAGDGGTGADHLALMNKLTGRATVIGPYGTCTGVPTPAAGGQGNCTIEGIEGIAFDPQGNLWGVHSTRGRAGAPGLYSINPTTGAATFQGAFIDGVTGQAFTGNVTSLAITPEGVAYAGTSKSAVATDAGYLLRIDLATRVVTKLGRPITTGSALAGLTVPR